MEGGKREKVMIGEDFNVKTGGWKNRNRERKRLRQKF